MPRVHRDSEKNHHGRNLYFAKPLKYYILQQICRSKETLSFAWWFQNFDIMAFSSLIFHNHIILVSLCLLTWNNIGQGGRPQEKSLTGQESSQLQERLLNISFVPRARPQEKSLIGRGTEFQKRLLNISYVPPSPNLLAAVGACQGGR